MKLLMQTLGGYVGFVYDKTHWFTDKEAWGVFRFFAFVEAGGWTLLILAIIYRSLGLPQADSVISFAGHSHGIFFSLYFIMIIILARSMGWGVWRIGLAIVAGIPPYGSIVFERLMSAHRKHRPENVTPPAGIED